MPPLDTDQQQPASEVREMLVDAILADVPVLLIGEPGTGKTSIVRSVAETFGVDLHTIIASTYEPSDIIGLPLIDHEHPLEVNGMQWPGVRQVPPRWAIEAMLRPAIVFFDEINSAAPATLAALLRVILEKRTQELVFPRHSVAMLAAMNPPEMAAGGNELPPAMANRFEHIPFKVNPHYWAEHFTDGFARTKQTQTNRKFGVGLLDQNQWAANRRLISEYIQRNPQALLRYPANQADATGPFATPRSWDMFCRLLTACPDESRQLRHGECTIGVDDAREFFAWMGEQQVLIDPEAALADPESFPLPKRVDAYIRTLDTIASAVENNLARADRIDRIYASWEICKRLIAIDKRDHAAYLARKLLSMQVRNSSRFQPWPNAPRSILDKLSDLLT